MATSIIKVYNNRYGKWAKGVRVTLGFSFGHTQPVYTDESGTAVINHSSTGSATVYIDGRDEGKINTPTSTTVTVNIS